MRVNMPVTNVERVMRDGEYIVSRTDTRGIITYVNPYFVEISGFTEAELIGSPHNIVRHPDMPAEAFQDLWDTIKQGRPWRGLVKNRCKNGDYYWVDAHVTPVREGGQITGYLSVRRKPSRDAILKAEALYKDLREGKVKSLRPTGLLAWFNEASLRLGLISTLVVLIVIALIMGGLGLYGLHRQQAALEEVHGQSVMAQLHANRIRSLLSENLAQVALAVQHDPEGRMAKQHDHPVGVHLDKIEANIAEIGKSLTYLQGLGLSPELKTKLDALLQARNEFGQLGLLPAVQAIKDEFYDSAVETLVRQMNPLYGQLDRATLDFVAALVSHGEGLIAAGQAQNRFMAWVFGGMVFTALLVSLVAGFILMRVILRPLDHAKDVFRRIAEGRYDNDIQIERRDEIGQVLEELEGMQTRLAADVAEAKRVAEESLRIKTALDNVSANVMMADNDRRIIYMNKAVQEMFRRVEADIRKQMPQFDSKRLLGASIDQFHKNPQHQAQLLATFTSTHRASMKIGGRSMTVIANPVINEKGERLGSVVEWADRTAEVAVEEEVAQLITAAAAGDLGRRLSLEGKEGFFRQLSEAINGLLDTTERGIRDVARVLKALAEGDLTQRIDADYQGLFGELKDACNTTGERLKEIVAQIREATDAINTAAREIASGNADLSSRTEAQASSLEETASSMDELTSTVKQNAENARQANQLAQGASGVAVKGGQVVNDVVHTMGAIAEASRKIADIIGVIDGIAFQTNILALNAAVEAARAGEQGRGFAVVAGEVRNLAQRSATAAKEIKSLISDSVDKVNEGHKLVEQAGATMDEIVQAVKRVTDIMGEITAASVEQSQGIEQVNAAVAQMDEMTQQNAALVEEAAAAAESLQEQADALARAVARFRLSAEGGEIRLPAAAPPRTAARSVARKATPVVKPAANPPVRPSSTDEDDWEEF